MCAVLYQSSVFIVLHAVILLFMVYNELVRHQPGGGGFGFTRGGWTIVCYTIDECPYELFLSFLLLLLFSLVVYTSTITTTIT